MPFSSSLSTSVSYRTWAYPPPHHSTQVIVLLILSLYNRVGGTYSRYLIYKRSYNYLRNEKNKWKKKKHSSAKIVQPKQRHRKGRNALMSACDDDYRGINLESCPRKLRKFGKRTFFTGLAFFFFWEKNHVKRLAAWSTMKSHKISRPLLL